MNSFVNPCCDAAGEAPRSPRGNPSAAAANDPSALHCLRLDAAATGGLRAAAATCLFPEVAGLRC